MGVFAVDVVAMLLNVCQLSRWLTVANYEALFVDEIGFAGKSWPLDPDAEMTEVGLRPST